MRISFGQFDTRKKISWLMVDLYGLLYMWMGMMMVALLFGIFAPIAVVGLLKVVLPSEVGGIMEFSFVLSFSLVFVFRLNPMVFPRRQLRYICPWL